MWSWAHMSSRWSYMCFLTSTTYYTLYYPHNLPRNNRTHTHTHTIIIATILTVGRGAALPAHMCGSYICTAKRESLKFQNRVISIRCVCPIIIIIAHRSSFAHPPTKRARARANNIHNTLEKTNDSISVSLSVTRFVFRRPHQHRHISKNPRRRAIHKYI